MTATVHCGRLWAVMRLAMLAPSAWLERIDPTPTHNKNLNPFTFSPQLMERIVTRRVPPNLLPQRRRMHHAQG
jgi:hypothetical protein